MDASTRSYFAGLILACSLLAGCGTARKLAISSMTPVIETTVEAVYRDRDLETVREAIPGNLLLVRGLSETNPGDRDLAALTAQLYFSYGVAFIEDEDPDRARLLYQQGLAAGTRTLSNRGWFDLDRDIESFQRGLRKADPADLPLLFWTVANWTKWIAWSMNEPEALVQLPYLEETLDRVLEIDGSYFFGMPHLMKGTLEASKPVLMGGNLETAKSQFDQAFTLSERKLLIFHLFYAQYYCRALLDEESFETTLREVLDADPDLLPEYRLMNEVARRKAASLLEQKDDLF